MSQQLQHARTAVLWDRLARTASPFLVRTLPTPRVLTTESRGWTALIGRRRIGLEMRIGIISDTHGLLRPEAAERLAGVDHIIHAGDIGRAEVIEGLRRIAPVTAIRGNIDQGEWAVAYPQTALVKLGGRSIYVLHDRKALDLDPGTAGIDVVVSGHSHRPKIEIVGGVLYLNPGSAGPRRFSLPIALATLELTGNAVRPCIQDVGRRAVY